MRKARGLGNVYQPSYRDRSTGELRHTSTWWIVYSVNGKRRAENARTDNRSEAFRLLKKRLGAAAAGKPLEPSFDRTNLDDLISMVEADYKASGQRSVSRVEDAAIHLRAFFGGHRKARDITTDLVTRYRAARLQPTDDDLEPRRAASPSTVNYELAILRRGFRLGMSAGKVANCPTIKTPQVQNARKGFFEPEQHRAVMRHLPEHLKPLAAITYATGWRTHSELLTRQWRHVDMAKGWLRLDPGETKNGEGREFPFTPEMRLILEAQRDRVHDIEKKTGQIVPWVFCHANGRPIKDFRGAWKKACDAAGASGRLVHDFRRTAVRNLERAGVPRSAAMAMTGHKTEAVYRRYAIVDAGMLREAAVKLSALHHSEKVELQK